MSIDQGEFLSPSYSCAAAFSVWIPKPLQAQQKAGRLSLAEQRRKQLTQGYWPPDSLSFKDFDTSGTN
jgi:hypothetical protein